MIYKLIAVLMLLACNTDSPIQRRNDNVTRTSDTCHVQWADACKQYKYFYHVNDRGTCFISDYCPEPKPMSPK